MQKKIYNWKTSMKVWNTFKKEVIDLTHKFEYHSKIIKSISNDTIIFNFKGSDEAIIKRSANSIELTNIKAVVIGRELLRIQTNIDNRITNNIIPTEFIEYIALLSGGILEFEND